MILFIFHIDGKTDIERGNERKIIHQHRKQNGSAKTGTLRRVVPHFSEISV